jgi:RecA-family ATPase
LYGKAGCGKTLFLHSFVSQLAQGGVLLGGVIRTEPEAPRRVLFFEGDADVSLFNERVRAFRFETPSNLRFVFLGNLQKNGLDLDLGSLEGQNLLARFVDDFLPDVIVIDTIQSFHTKDENDSTQMKTVLTSLVRLSSERKLAAVLIHHARKSPPQFSNARLGDEAAQGTNMFLRRAGTVLALEKLASGEKIIHSLSIKKSWYGATRDDIAGFEIGPNFYEDGLSLHYIRAPQINAPNPGGRPSKREAIRDTIATLEGEITLSNLVEVLPGVSRATIQSVLSAMVERGELTRTGHGKNVGYRLNL